MSKQASGSKLGNVQAPRYVLLKANSASVQQVTWGGHTCNGLIMSTYVDVMLGEDFFYEMKFRYLDKPHWKRNT